jgi:hypothetical protein
MSWWHQLSMHCESITMTYMLEKTALGLGDQHQTVNRYHYAIIIHVSLPLHMQT